MRFKNIFPGVIALVSCIVFPSAAVCQDENRYSLEQCIEKALQSSHVIRRSDLQVKTESALYRESWMNLLPSLNGAVGHGINQGRSIDPFTNSYVNQQLRYASYRFDVNLDLFNGFSSQYTIRRFNCSMNASELDLKQAKDNLSLQVMLAYLDVLSNEDQAEQAQLQVMISRNQLERLEKLYAEGAVPPPQLYDIKGQLKDNEVHFLNAKSALQLSKLTLSQLMNIAYTPDMKLERKEEELVPPAGLSPLAIYTHASENLPGVKAAALHRKSAEAAVKSIKGQRLPVFSLNANVNSNYSSAATYMSEGISKPISYADQLSKNTFSSVGLNLRLPVFNAYQAQTRATLAMIELENRKIDEEEAKRRLRQEVEQACLDMNHAWQRYQAALEQVEAYTVSFHAAEIRFNSGVGSTVDYLTAKTNLDRANYNRIQAKYDYIFRRKVINYYNAG